MYIKISFALHHDKHGLWRSQHSPCRNIYRRFALENDDVKLKISCRCCLFPLLALIIALIYSQRQQTQLNMTRKWQFKWKLKETFGGKAEMELMRDNNNLTSRVMSEKFYCRNETIFRSQLISCLFCSWKLLTLSLTSAFIRWKCCYESSTLRYFLIKCLLPTTIARLSVVARDTLYQLGRNLNAFATCCFRSRST